MFPGLNTDTDHLSPLSSILWFLSADKPEGIKGGKAGECKVEMPAYAIITMSDVHMLPHIL